jgi:hypothetical protein
MSAQPNPAGVIEWGVNDLGGLVGATWGEGFGVSSLEFQVPGGVGETGSKCRPGAGEGEDAERE